MMRWNHDEESLGGREGAGHAKVKNVFWSEVVVELVVFLVVSHLHCCSLDLSKQ